MEKPEILSLLQSECSTRGLDFLLLQAIITQESGWNPLDIRYEPNSKITVTPTTFAQKCKISLPTEFFLQSCSFGLCQLMGYNFRDLGFSDSLIKTFDPTINIKYFALFFKNKCDRYPVLEDKIATYNRGYGALKKLPSGKYSNQNYVDSVLNLYQNLKTGK